MTSQSLLILACVALLMGCSPEASRKRQDELRVQSAVVAFRSGDVIRRMNEARARDSARFFPQDATSPQPSVTEPAASAAVADPCPQVPDVAEGATRDEFKATLRALGACLRGLTQESVAAKMAIPVFENYDLHPPVPLSQMPTELLATVTRAAYVAPGMLYGSDSPLLSKIRNRYTNEDLVELSALAARRLKAFRTLANQVYAALDARPGVVARSGEIDRWAALVAMRDTKDDLSGAAMGAALKDLLISNMPTPRSLRAYPVALLNPFALMGLIPGEGREDRSLDPGNENPFVLASSLLTELGGDEMRVKGILELYKSFRDRDNPPMPEHEPASESAVRVAFVDSGIDFEQYSELGLFAGDGTQGQLKQGDYGDLDGNPWAPTFTMLGHGTGTMGTMMTLVSQQAPEILTERGLDVAMWKVFSIRALLMGAPYNASTTDPRNPTALLDAIRAQTAPGTNLPHIVSASVSGETDSFFRRVGAPRILQELPWLWIMAAGNDGQEVRPNLGACFDDVPAEDRPVERILCVGALRRMEGERASEAQIAYYSNFGPRVDLYAYETYDGRCPNGTSCSTPAITAAAVQIKAKFPAATPAQLKQILVGASREESLEVQPKPNTLPVSPLPRRTVKVFDPLTMMDAAMARAAELLGGPVPVESPAPISSSVEISSPAPEASPEPSVIPEPQASPAPAASPSPLAATAMPGSSVDSNMLSELIARLIESGRRWASGLSE